MVRLNGLNVGAHQSLPFLPSLASDQIASLNDVSSEGVFMVVYEKIGSSNIDPYLIDPFGH